MITVQTNCKITGNSLVKYICGKISLSTNFHLEDDDSPPL